MLYALQHVHRVGDRRLVDRHRLEAALESGILFDILAVLGQRGCAYDLHLAARERGLEHVGGVHAALGVACANYVMNLVYEQYNVPRVANLAEQSQHARLELPAELRACDQRRQVDEIDLLTAQLIGHVAVGYAGRQRLRNRGFADARLADEAGIVLLAAAEYLYHALQLPLAPDNFIELALRGKRGEVAAVGVEELTFFLFGCGILLIATGLLAALLLVGDEPALAEQLGKIYRGRAAVFAVVDVRGQDVAALEQVHNVVLHILELIRGDAQLTHYVAEHVVDRQSQLLGAAQAKALRDLLSVLHFGHEHSRDPFFTS